MHTRKFILAAFLLTIATEKTNAQCVPVNLKCEYLVNPIGLDVAEPRLTWNWENCESKGSRQTAYRIIIGSDSVQVAKGNGSSWTSGKIASGKMLATAGSGTLKPFTKYFWTVQTWDGNGRASRLAPVAHFETGMMDKRSWSGSWITDGMDVTKKPAPYFRKEFVATKKIRSARAYVAVGGLYELFFNGKRVGNDHLNPMYTRFDRRILYVTHDVTPYLNDGGNAIGVVLGNGWFNHQSTAVWHFDKAPWRARPKFSMDLRITYEDGTTETISTGAGWKTASGPLIFNSIYTAEHYDARLEQEGWSKAGFADSAWRNIAFTGAPAPLITAQQLQPIRDGKILKPVSVKKINASTYVYDLGQNISGVSEMKVSGKAGTTLRLVHAERLTKEGRADQSNIDYHYRPTDNTDPFHTDIFILSGKGEETFRPRFNYKGFQFVEVQSNEPIILGQENLTGYFMHSAVPPKGRISSSSQLLNKIWEATNNSYLSNLFGYPTDCPQREKNGWTGDAHIAIETGLYNFDGITVYEKWLADHRDEQQPNGVLPSIIPTGGWGYDWGNGPDWTSTIALIPWNIYLFYGDVQLLDKSYDAIKKYVDHIDRRSPAGLTDWGLGDWIPVKSIANKELTSSLYFYVDALILSKAAGLLQKTEDHKKYSALAEKIRSAINAKFLNREKGIYASGLQTELSAPLYWGVVPEELKAKVTANLSKKVAADGSMDVGLLGTKTILNALSENGYADQAYGLAAREDYPSWGYWIKNGATTLFENWKIEGSNDISMNHIMFGEISAWYYKALGGIFPDAQNPGFQTVLLKPNFVAGLDSFSAEHAGPYGKITSAWKKRDGKIQYSAIIPPNSKAILTIKAKKLTGIPAGNIKRESANLVIQLTPGTHEVVIEP
ncbi:family 78 glycoside hydrolase catalytic domain [Flavisolibacter sp. BT320]|nr:family 78 glycoside hydrolase catalytic domain [Flavisolibacter longurius]